MKLLYSPAALDDLQNVKASIIENFDDVTLANNVLKMITTRARNLELFPYMGEEVRLPVSGSTGYRYLFIKKNYVFYRIEKEQILIVRILHEKQDYIRILFGISEVEDD